MDGNQHEPYVGSVEPEPSNEKVVQLRYRESYAITAGIVSGRALHRVEVAQNPYLEPHDLSRTGSCGCGAHGGDYRHGAEGACPGVH